MKRGIKVIWGILFFCLVLTFAVYFFSDTFNVLSVIMGLTNDQISYCLTSLDIVLTSVLTVYTYLDQKASERRCIYKFSIENDNLSLEKYRRFPFGNSNAYCYDCHRKNDDIETPYYGMEIKLEERAMCSVGVPLCMEVDTSMDGKSITFSGLRVYAKNQGMVWKSKYIRRCFRIERPIQDGMKFLIRLQLLCNHQLEKQLLDSCIYLSFTMKFKDDRGGNYKKFIFLKVQNTMGESRVLTNTSKNNWLSYIGNVLLQLHRLHYT